MINGMALNFNDNGLNLKIKEIQGTDRSRSSLSARLKDFAYERDKFERINPITKYSDPSMNQPISFFAKDSSQETSTNADKKTLCGQNCFI